TQITGTSRHPVWNPDVADWRGLGEFQPGHCMQSRDGLVTVVAVEFLPDAAPVYNFEVAGEHVYEIAELGILVHNAAGWDCSEFLDLRRRALAALDGGTPLSKAENVRYQELLGHVGNFRSNMEPADLAKLLNSKPTDQVSHLHHILPKLGILDQTSKRIVALQEVLWHKYGIDPFTSLDIFVHAQYKGVHSVEAQLHVINKLESVFANNPPRSIVIKTLRGLGNWAANGGLNN
ncbi:MAG: hypothetical protein K9M08_23945, partial [Pirellula sp.]|nr:hypothetical protein [Pirellula sp.]